MDDGAGIGLKHHRDVFVDGVIGLHLEAPPVCPHGRADAFLGEQIGDLVAFDRMVEGRDLIAKLLRHIDDEAHFVCAVAVVVDEDLARQHARQRLHGKIARHVLALVELALIFSSTRPGLAVDRHVAHAGLWHLALAAINALGVFPARHFQPIGRARKLHPLHIAGIDILDRDRTAPEQIGRTGQDLKCGHAAICECARKAGVLWPNAMFGPDFGADSAGRFIAIAMRIHARRGVVAKV